MNMRRRLNNVCGDAADISGKVEGGGLGLGLGFQVTGVIQMIEWRLCLP